MIRLKYLFLGICLGLSALGDIRQSAAQEPTGTLVFNLKNFTTDVKFPKKTKPLIDNAVITWGVSDKTLLFTMVNARFINADALYLTRFGEQKTLELKPGEYSITCIAHDFVSAPGDVQKFLSKNAFFNIGIMKFSILPGKTTTLDIDPVYVAESNTRIFTKITMFIPDLKVRVMQDGAPQGESVFINQRTDKSITWDDYKGPLKH